MTTSVDALLQHVIADLHSSHHSIVVAKRAFHGDTSELGTNAPLTNIALLAIPAKTTLPTIPGGLALRITAASAPHTVPY